MVGAPRASSDSFLSSDVLTSTAQGLGVSPGLVRRNLKMPFPKELSGEACLDQAVDRVVSARAALSPEMFDRVFLRNDQFGKWLETEQEGDVFERLWLLFSRSLTGEGDFAFTLLAPPSHPSWGVLDMAHIDFIFLDGAPAITGMKGPPSSSNHNVVKRFGLEIFQQDLYGKTQRSLAGIKPFNFLIGLLHRMCMAKGITRVRGFDRELLSYGSAGNIKHPFHGTFMATGLRPTDDPGVYEACLENDKDVKKCFRRITGRHRAVREPVFRQAEEGLMDVAPFLFERPEQSISEAVARARERLVSL